MGKEIELKYRADSAEQLEAVYTAKELRASAVGEGQIFRMETTYLDTPDGAIGARKWTFRRRTENERAVICLKTPAARKDGPTAPRGEWETEEPELSRAIDALIADGAPAELKTLTAQGVHPVCGASFLRRAQLLRLPDGSTCELACDAGELFGGTKKQPFFEVELELKSGEPTQLPLLGARLEEQFGLHGELDSKFVRANRLRENDGQ